MRWPSSSASCCSSSGRKASSARPRGSGDRRDRAQFERCDREVDPMTVTPETPTDVVHQDDSLETEATDVEQERAARRRRALTVAGAVALGFVIMWVVATSMTGTIPSIFASVIRSAIEPQTAAVAIAVIGLNIHFGFTGLLN